MHWADRRYSVTLVRASTQKACLWEYATWRGLAALLEPLLAEFPEKDAVRVQQMEIDKPLGSWLPFGRLRLNDASNQKWAHGSPALGGKDAAWRFCGFECWSPSWTVCWNKGDMTPPDLLLMFQGEMPLSEPKGKSPTQDLLLAIAEDHSAAIGTRATAFIDAVVAAIGPAQINRMTKPWGQPIGSGVMNPLPDWFQMRWYERE